MVMEGEYMLSWAQPCRWSVVFYEYFHTYGQVDTLIVDITYIVMILHMFLLIDAL